MTEVMFAFEQQGFPQLRKKKKKIIRTQALSSFFALQIWFLNRRGVFFLLMQGIQTISLQKCYKEYHQARFTSHISYVDLSVKNLLRK